MELLIPARRISSLQRLWIHFTFRRVSCNTRSLVIQMPLVSVVRRSYICGIVKTKIIWEIRSWRYFLFEAAHAHARGILKSLFWQCSAHFGCFKYWEGAAHSKGIELGRTATCRFTQCFCSGFQVWALLKPTKQEGPSKTRYEPEKLGQINSFQSNSTQRWKNIFVCGAPVSNSDCSL